MASQYSHLQFFRRTPNSQLAAYFAFKSIDLGIDLSDLKETDTETILQAFTKLPDNQQSEIEAATINKVIFLIIFFDFWFCLLNLCVCQWVGDSWHISPLL